MKDIKVSPKEKKKQRNNVAVIDKKNLPQNEKQKLVEQIKNNIIKKCLHVIIRNLFCLENIVSFLGLCEMLRKV